jgi:FkbM family methyltransferase
MGVSRSSTSSSPHELLARGYQAAVLIGVKPYIRRELPGWGRLYRHIVEARHGRLWRGVEPQWVRGKLHGYQMLLRLDRWSNRRTYFLGRFYDLPSQLVLQRTLKAGDLFVDVGANEGMMSLLASHLVGPAGRVIAFEPNPEPRGVFEQNVRQNAIRNIEIHACGLGAETSELTLFIPDRNSGEGTFTALDTLPGRSVVCPVEVGADVLAGQRPALIKIDVEGFEIQVLRGLRPILAGAKPFVLTEVVAAHLARDGRSLRDLVGLFDELGYEGKRLEFKRHGLKPRQELLLLEADGEDGDYLWAHRSHDASRLVAGR